MADTESFHLVIVDPVCFFYFLIIALSLWMQVPTKFRYPLFCELHWYVLERYVSCLMCRNHRIKSAEEICLEDGKTYEQSGEGKSGRETIDQDNCKK